MQSNQIEETSDAIYINAAFTFSDDKTSSGINTSHHIEERQNIDRGKKCKKKSVNSDKSSPQISYFELFRFASAMDWILLTIASVSSCISGIGLPIMLILFGNVINSFVKGGVDQEAIYASRCSLNSTNITDKSNVMEEFSNFAVYSSIMGAIRFVLGFISISSFNYAAEKQIFRIRSRFFKAVLRQEIGWYDTKSSNDFASRITEDLAKVQEGIGEKIGMLIFCASIGISCIITAFLHGWKLTLVMLASTPILTIAMGIVSKVQASLTETELKTYATAGGVAEEVFGAIRTVTAFGGQEKEVGRYDESLTMARKAGVKRGLVTAVGNGLVWGINYASYALVFWYGVKLILESCDRDSGYTASDLLIVFFNVLIGAMQIGKMTPYLEAFSVARGAASNIFCIIDRVPLIDSTSEEGEKPDGNIRGSLSFHNVHFSYPSRPDVKILNGLNFHVSSGQTVALVGTSGCGKSTCIQLLQRFYDPKEGEVCIDGNDIRDLNIGWMRAQIGVVGQEPVLFGTTIEENIRYGRKGVTQVEIEAAAKEANAHDFILRLPLKYDTMVGERGAQLSGGQKQRIAIARALVRNPKILLLDEATSALDNQSEAVVQRALDKARLGRTTIIVAHRLSTIRNADRIIVIKEGVVQEEGTHQMLMTRQGAYYELVVSQQNGNDEENENFNIDKEKMNHPSNIENVIISDHQDVEIINAIQLNSSESGDSETIEKEACILDILKMNKNEWPIILLGGICSAIVGVSTPIYAILFAQVMGVLSPGGSLEEIEEKRSKGDYYSLMFLILGLAVGLAAFIQSLCFSFAGEALTSRLRTLSFRAILKQEIGWFDGEANNTGSLCARLSGDAASVQGATGSRIGLILEAVSTMTACVILSLYYEWRLGLAAMCFVPPLMLSTYYHHKIILGQSTLERDGLQKSAKVAIETIGNIRTVASLGKEKYFHNAFIESLKDSHRGALKKTLVRGCVFGFANSLFMFSYGITLYYGGWLVTYAGVNYVNVIAVSEALIMGTNSVGEALAFSPNYNKAKVAANRIFSLLSRVPLIESNKLSDGASMGEVNGRVDFDLVDFRYPTRKNTQVLQGLTLDVKRGQNVALVGQSGCGKSTCIQLLERFYDPDDGQVKLDGQNIRPVNITSLRSHMSIVSQEPVLFNRTIGENIAYGDNSREVTLDEIIESSRKANIHTFIHSLPNGYDTMVGERGTQLSGGQKQRVAIARALVRNPKILLLDEATSALDSESERVVQMALDVAREGRTCITIAHRLSTIHNCDNIIVINHGKVQEQGTHDELLRLKGYYFDLNNVQGC